MINRTIFFDNVRALFGGRLSQSQVDGFNMVFGVWEESFMTRTPLTQLAVCLATMKWETAGTMQPIREHGDRAYFFKMYDKDGSRPKVAAALGNTQAGDGERYCGRGDVQLTGRANYRRATKRLRELGLIGADADLEADPAIAQSPRIAALIMFLGMEEGWFTGKSLDSLVDGEVDGDEHADFLASRAIINGTDRAAEIAKIADGMLAALRAAWRPDVEPSKPKPPAAAAPMPDPQRPDAPPAAAPVPAKDAGWFANFLEVLRSGRK